MRAWLRPCEYWGFSLVSLAGPLKEHRWNASGVRVAFQLGLLAAVVPVPARPQGTYTTNFRLTENPISEGGNWVNGATTGLRWGNVRTMVGTGGVHQATGTIVNSHPPYNDSTAVLAGTWGANQSIQAVVHTVHQNRRIQEEVELRLRTAITADRITGYEFDFRVTSDGSQYLALVRWNGPINDFTYLRLVSPGGPGLHDGDVIMVTAIGSVLAGYINGVRVMQVTDGTYTGGSPGIGFWNLGGTVSDFGDFGFTSITATDGSPHRSRIPRDQRFDPFRGAGRVPNLSMVVLQIRQLAATFLHCNSLLRHGPFAGCPSSPRLPRGVLRLPTLALQWISREAISSGWRDSR